MANHVNRDLQDLERLMASFAEVILEFSDEEIMALANEDGEDISVITEMMRGAYENAQRSLLKEKLVTAKSEVTNYRNRTFRNSLPHGPSNVRNQLACILEALPEAKNKLTLAARNGKGMSDNDILSLLEDLEDLNLLPPIKKA